MNAIQQRDSLPLKLRYSLTATGMAIFIMGMLVSVGGQIQAGALLTLFASIIIPSTAILYFIQLSRRASGLNWQILWISAALFAGAIIILHGFSTSINVMMAFRVPIFTTLFISTGFFLPLLHLIFSIQSAHHEDKRWIMVGSLISTCLCLFGFMAFIRLIPFPPVTILYSWVFLLFFYLIFLTTRYITSKEPIVKRESLSLLLISIAFAGFWMVRFVLKTPLEDGLLKLIFHLGLIPFLLLPLSIFTVRRFYPYLIFLFYFVALDVYFIQYDSSFNYLITVGTEGCQGYGEGQEFPINDDPGISMEALFREPSSEELEEIREEWKEKDFSPKDVQVVYRAQLENGDSINVISHLVNGSIHYGAIRIPYGLPVETAPILLVLEGGGTGIDLSHLNKLTRGRCREQADQFISILPSYRGCIIRGEDFCFRSEGYYGDPWLGPAEDATSFLNAVKHLYQKGDDTRVLANGLSRGATVALIIGSLTEALDYIIATSSHTKFLDEHVISKEKVGQSYPMAFYTPSASPEIIRKRLIASSPCFFAESLPPFDLHQGGLDQQTTIWHSDQLRKSLIASSRDPNTYHIYMYEDQGHGFDDEQTVCESFSEFLHTYSPARQPQSTTQSHP